MHSSLRSIVLFAACASPLGALAQFSLDTPSRPTEDIISAYIEATERICLGKMNPSQRERMRVILNKFWGQGETAQQVVGTIQGMQQLQQMPARTQRLALMSNILDFLTKTEDAVRQGDESSILMLEVYRQNNPGLIPEAPLFSKALADAYVDAFLFLGSVQSGKPEPKLSEDSRQKLRVQLARDYAKASKGSRDTFQKNVAKVMGHMIQWPNLDPLQKLMVRADLGAKLTSQEQSYLAQAQQMMNRHSMAMMSSELNAMRRNTDTIMGSAPMWNPSTNRWEQKGGIVTEFGVTRVGG